MTIEALTALSALLLILGSLSFWFRAAWALRLPENRSYYVAPWIAGVGLAIFSLSGSPGWWGAAAVIALLVGVPMLVTMVISRQRTSGWAIHPGASLPEFSALDDRGARFESSSLAGQRVLLKFFRDLKLPASD